MHLGSDKSHAHALYLLSKCKGYVVMKFDCLKVSGKVDCIRSVVPMNGGYKATVSIGGAVIPNLQLTNKIYDELEVGEDVTLYGIFKSSSKKENNLGVLYGLKKENGEKMFSTSFRFMVPMILVGAAAISFCLIFLVGWFLSLFVVIFLGGEGQDYIFNTTVLAIVEASAVALFFLWRAWVVFSATSDPESWEIIAPATLSSRFSKFHK